MTRRRWLAMGAAGALAAAERKGRAPVSRESLVVKFPEAEPVKLANGVTVIAVEDNRLPIVTIGFRTEGAGPIYSARPVAEMTADMLREGAGGRTGKQIIEEAARLGATFSVSAQAGAETAGVDGAGLAARWADWFALQSSLMLQPTFPADDFSQVRQRWLVRLRIHAGPAGQTAEDNLMRLTFGSHPAGTVMPTAESLAAVTPETLQAWHRERYTPGNTVLISIGRVSGAAFRSEAEKVLGGWKGADVKATLPPNPTFDGKRRIVLVDRPGAPQTEIAVGGLLFDRRDPDYFAGQLANSVLGGGTASRLFQSLREEKGYAYNANSTINTSRFSGFWRARATVRADASADALAILLSHLKRLCDEPVSAEDLETAKRGVSGSFALGLEQPGTVLTLSYLRYRYGFSADYWERYPARLNAISASEVQAVAQKYWNPERAHIVAVGDASKIRPALAKLGMVEGPVA